MPFWRAVGRGAAERIGHRATDKGIDIVGGTVGVAVRLTALFVVIGGLRAFANGSEGKDFVPDTLSYAWDSAQKTGQFIYDGYKVYLEPSLFD